jgi:single-strand DNA-binding protein
MPNFNLVVLMGNLTREPNLAYTTNQTPVVEFGIAVNRKFRKADESQGQEVCFVECQCYGKRAEVIAKYFKKGSAIYVQGRLKFESWDKDGVTHSKLRVVVESFEFLDKKDGDV